MSERNDKDIYNRKCGGWKIRRQIRNFLEIVNGLKMTIIFILLSEIHKIYVFLLLYLLKLYMSITPEGLKVAKSILAVCPQIGMSPANVRH